MGLLSRMCAAMVLCFVAITVPSVSVARVAVDAEDSRYSMRILYNNAVALFYKKKYKDAVVVLDKIEALYPFSSIAIEGSLMLAVAHYELGDYEEAYGRADGYVAIYPNSKIVDYAYYLRIISKYMSIPDLGLDPTNVMEVKELATEFVRMFPDSKYVSAVSEILHDVRVHMAAKEFLIAKFYMKRGEHAAAISRFSRIVGEYQDSRYFAESVYRLVESYMAIGDEQAANAALLKLAAVNDDSAWHRRGVRCIAKRRC